MGLMARLKGEEPGLIERLPHALRGKGHYGEYLIGYALEHAGLGDVAVFSNVLVPRASGPTSMSEIDTIMLHEKGVFVFESKNYSGWIFGSADQQKWTVTFKGGTRQQFYNPVKQNVSHIKALSAHLGLPAEAFRSYIVFSERCELKKFPRDTTDFVVCRRHHLIRLLRDDIKRRPATLDARSLEAIGARISALAGDSSECARAAHVKEARRVASGEACPLCGSELVERNGKYGPFVGCSAYPSCRYTRDL